MGARSSLFCCAVLVSAIASFAADAAAQSRHVVAFSSLPHFSCSHASPSSRGLCEDPLNTASEPLAERATADLMGGLIGRHVADSITAVSSRLAADATRPSVVLGVSSAVSEDLQDLLEEISDAVVQRGANNRPSSFAGVVKSGLSSDGASAVAARFGGEEVSADRLSELAKTEPLAGSKTRVLSVSVRDAAERASLFSALRTLSERSGGKVAVVWESVRDEKVAKKQSAAEQSAEKGAAAGAAAAAAVEAEAAKRLNGTGAGASKNTTAAASNSTNPGFKKDGSLVKKTSMNPPEITSAGLVGLLVALVLLIILAPGLLCLYNIEASQTFEQMDKDDAKKKMQ